MILFFALTLVLEVLLIYSFQSFGLVDRNVWITTILIPYVNWSFIVSISPLFHLLPIGVIAVLLTSWAYLTKYTGFVPQRVEPTRRVSTQPRREPEARRFKSLRRFMRRLNRRLQRFGKALRMGIQRVRGVSYISQRLFFARAAVRSAVTVLVVFFCVAFLVLLAEYPYLVYYGTVNLYRGTPVLLNFVSGTAELLQGVGQAAPPLGGLGSSVKDALVGSAPGFRRSLEGVGASLIGPIVQLDVVDKYVLSQNLAAWASALVALVCGAYVSSRPSRRPKGIRK